MIPFQHIYADDPETMAAALARDEAALVDAEAAGDDAAQLDLLGRLGEQARMLGWHDEAIAHLQSALDLARVRGDGRHEVVNRIRFATALQYAERHAEADALFRTAFAAIERTGERTHADFAHQHYGKCLVELGRVPEAMAHFEIALALRRMKGDAGLIASMEAALAAARVLAPGVRGS